MRESNQAQNIYMSTLLRKLYEHTTEEDFRKSNLTGQATQVEL